MCLIIHKPAGIEVPLDLLDSAWIDNPDGAGIMYMGQDGKPVTYKVLPGNWADPARHIERVLTPLKDVPVGIHFRWRTHGPVDERNTHPYQIPATDRYVMHNGILSVDDNYKLVEDVMSDTGYFTVTRLHSAPPTTDTDFWKKVADDIGANNRMLVMDEAGQFIRVSTTEWHLYKGLRLSNALSLPENSNWRHGFNDYYGTGYTFGPRGIDYSDDTAGRGHRHGRYGTTIMLPSKLNETATTTETTPRKLTRKERRVLTACLKANSWGPMSQLYSNKGGK